MTIPEPCGCGLGAGGPMDHTADQHTACGAPEPCRNPACHGCALRVITEVGLRGWRNLVAKGWA